MLGFLSLENQHHHDYNEEQQTTAKVACRQREKFGKIDGGFKDDFKVNIHLLSGNMFIGSYVFNW